MAERQWAPPEQPDVTLRQPVRFHAELAGPLTGIDPPQPVWAYIAFEQIPTPLHLKCFAIASSDVAVLVQFVHMGYANRIWLERDRVTHRVLKERRPERG